MVSASLLWATPDGDEMVVRVARVTSPQNAGNMATGSKLIKYLIQHKHWSPFDMVYACVLIEGIPRTITRQMLRHWSFRFQEFSTRYAAPRGLTCFSPVLMRPKTGNRQGGCIPEGERETEAAAQWAVARAELADKAREVFEEGARLGIAYETLRDVLPEGLTESRMFMCGSLRSWIHYLDLRTASDTQFDHRLVAMAIKSVLRPVFPMVFSAVDGPDAGEPADRQLSLPLDVQ